MRRTLSSHWQTLSCLEANGFTIDPLKWAWTIQETYWFGYWLTPTRLKPKKKCIFAILEQEKSQNIKERSDFLSASNTYRLMWPKQAHLLKPMTNQSGKKTFCWTPEMDKAFKTWKLSCCRCPHGKPQSWHTISHLYWFFWLPNGPCNHPTNMSSCVFALQFDWNPTKYHTIEKELLSIVMVL